MFCFSNLRYDNTWTGKHKIQCYFKYSQMANEVDNLKELMFRGWLDLQLEGWGEIFLGSCSIIEPLKS